jgi:ABC-type polysaccharide/polyol phosphate transport system ATPase subunit
MSETVIKVENLSKRYFVGHQTARTSNYSTLRDVIAREARNFTRKAVDMLHGRQIVQGDEIEDFWALKNVSFDVKQGEVIGIIGRNGAGKSTLLKILSRITEPTEGRVTLRGRVASLLEVGTGFHVELTGRENIFLNGAILGMKQSEIRSKFDEIIAFADIERFLDTPVKHYSSGMYVRLAFSVAAHLEPDILIVDEVLAVGDAEFQKKCLGKIDEVSRRQGRTTLFVTHNMETMLKICNRAILLHSGQIQASGDANAVLSTYFANELTSSRVIDLRNALRRANSPPQTFRLVQVATRNKRKSWSFLYGEDVEVELSIDSQVPLNDIKIAIALFSARGFEVASWTNNCTDTELSLSAGSNVFQITYRHLLLLPGQYTLSFGVHSTRAFGSEDFVHNAVTFEVLPSERSAQFNAHNFGGTLVPDISISKEG